MDAATHEHSVAAVQAQAAGQDAAGMAVLRRTNEEQEMPGNPREIVTMAERRFPVRIRVAVRLAG